MTKLLLCTDLDRTLLPNGPQSESSIARNKFRELASRDEVKLVYVSGRDKLLVQQAIKNYQLPEPAFVIADVGSSIYKIESGKWHFMQNWDDEISQDWNGKSNKELQLYLKDIKDIRLQEYGKQKPHKLSYYVPIYINHEHLLTTIYEHLLSMNVQTNLVWSVDAASNIGLLDILPASANKKHAIEFLMNEYDFNINETVFAGDSGNDIAVISSSIPSVLVANASDSVKQTAIKKVTANKVVNSLYIAKGDYYGMNGNYSAGIIEGVAHYIPEIESWLGLTDEK